MSQDIKAKLRASGQLDWYDRAKARIGKADEVPLDDEPCSNRSIYIIKKDGSLWTINGGYETEGEGDQQKKVLVAGTPYKQVRPGRKPITRQIFYCVCCKAFSDTLPVTHQEKGGDQ